MEKHSFKMKLPAQASEKSKQSKKAGNDSNQAMHATLLENSELSRIGRNIWETFLFGYTSLGTLQRHVIKIPYSQMQAGSSLRK